MKLDLSNNDVTLLSIEQVFTKDTTLKVIKKMGEKCASTDYARLLGTLTYNDHLDDDDSLKGLTSWWWLKGGAGDGEFFNVSNVGLLCLEVCNSRDSGVRPVITFDDITKLPKMKLNNHGVYEIEYGEYPQQFVGADLQELLDREYSLCKLRETGKTYTTDKNRKTDKNYSFEEYKHCEYEYNGKKYVRVEYKLPVYTKLSVDDYKFGNYVWLEVKPIKWLVDDKAHLLISKYILFGGIRYDCDSKNTVFEKTELYRYLNKYFIKEIEPSIIKTLTEEEKEKQAKRRNPYGFKFEEVSEEDIIMGSIVSNIPVFLHGLSSEGKSARIKQIDPNSVIIYLSNASPDSLNGKCVFNSDTNELIDIKPSWLNKLESICEKEPDKLHILFFDELTNALPSIQSMAFEIILNKEVNGMWKLPSNVRIAAAGNDVKDSLAANKMAEPLFNRFAHVYIKTTADKWLKWASENNIHPAIYSYIAYKRDSILRSKFNGETPNADPRKWEMASKMLYKTGNPEMLRSLLGEDITNEFVKFCSQQVITLDDVLNENACIADIVDLNTAARYATIVGLSTVDEDNYEKVRSFVTKLGSEYITVFNDLWTRGNPNRLEIVNSEESKLVRKRKK